MSELPVDVAKIAQVGADPGATAGSGKFYTKNSGGVTQSFYQASDGTVYQMTPLTLAAGAVTYQNLTNKLIIGPGTLANDSIAVQTLLGSITTLAVGTYRLSADIWTFKTDGTGRSISIAFAGTATYTGSLMCNSFVATGGANTVGASNNHIVTYFAPSATPQQVTTSNSAATRRVGLEGTITVTVAGSFIPQFKWSVAGLAGTIPILGHSYIELVPL